MRDEDRGTGISLALQTKEVGGWVIARYIVPKMVCSVPFLSWPVGGHKEVAAARESAQSAVHHIDPSRSCVLGFCPAFLLLTESALSNAAPLRARSHALARVF